MSARTCQARRTPSLGSSDLVVYYNHVFNSGYYTGKLSQLVKIWVKLSIWMFIICWSFLSNGSISGRLMLLTWLLIWEFSQSSYLVINLFDKFGFQISMTIWGWSVQIRTALHDVLDHKLKYHVCNQDKFEPNLYITSITYMYIYIHIILVYCIVLVYLHPLLLHATVMANSTLPPSSVENEYRTYENQKRFFGIKYYDSVVISLMGEIRLSTSDFWSSENYFDKLPIM